ncbi:MAG: hypothetical protein KIT60_13895 [Burkholderiaceae bacterium]|nr:hypothetical protein [Burkholderiaceae bacterium]
MPTLVAPATIAKRSPRALQRLAIGLAFVAAAVVSPRSWAVDGCLALLCFAAPNWRGIQQCVPPVVQVLRDLARGRPFPRCDMAGAGNSAQLDWAAAPTFCPPQYTRAVETESTTFHTCDYAGAVSVSINGELFSRTWWNMGGDAVTEFSSAAKAQLRSWDTRFDDDYARWLSQQPVVSETPQVP